jgi:hypothetical protein
MTEGLAALPPDHTAVGVPKRDTAEFVMDIHSSTRYIGIYVFHVCLLSCPLLYQSSSWEIAFHGITIYVALTGLKWLFVIWTWGDAPGYFIVPRWGGREESDEWDIHGHGRIWTRRVGRG